MIHLSYVGAHGGRIYCTGWQDGQETDWRETKFTLKHDNTLSIVFLNLLPPTINKPRGHQMCSVLRAGGGRGGIPALGQSGGDGRTHRVAGATQGTTILVR